MNTPEPTIEVSGLRKCFGARVALADFTLQLRPGEIYGAVGANGGGKTTALRLLAGLLPADGGRGQVLGVDLRARPARLRAQIGYMTQGHSLYGDLTVEENLLARARVYGVPSPRQRVDALLDEHGLRRFARERVRHLSDGWARRAQFAATLVPAPRVLLLDEPTAGLDLPTRQSLWEAVVALAADGTTAVVSTHDLGEAARCHLVGVFVEGEVVAHGAAEDIVAKSGARVVRVPAAGLDLAEARAGLPGLAAARQGVRHCELIFRGEVPAGAVGWLRDRNLSPQPMEPTLEDALSILVRVRTPAVAAA